MCSQILRLNKTQVILLRQGSNPWLLEAKSETDKAEFVKELTEKQALELIKAKHAQENIKMFGNEGDV